MHRSYRAYRAQVGPATEDSLPAAMSSITAFGPIIVEGADSRCALCEKLDPRPAPKISRWMDLEERLTWAQIIVDGAVIAP